MSQLPSSYFMTIFLFYDMLLSLSKGLVHFTSEMRLTRKISWVWYFFLKKEPIISLKKGGHNKRKIANLDHFLRLPSLLGAFHHLHLSYPAGDDIKGCSSFTAKCRHQPKMREMKMMEAMRRWGRWRRGFEFGVFHGKKKNLRLLNKRGQFYCLKKREKIVRDWGLSLKRTKLIESVKLKSSFEMLKKKKKCMLLWEYAIT